MVVQRDASYFLIIDCSKSLENTWFVRLIVKVLACIMHAG